MNNQIRFKKLIQTALLAALCFVSFTYLQIKIPVPGGDATSLHIGNTFCVLAALLLGGWYGGLAGAIGMTIADLIDPVYILVAPKTFILKLCIGLITGLIDPIVGFFYKQYILGQPQDAAIILAKLSATTTFINAVVSVILVVIIYNAIRPILKKSGLLLPV